jgi:phage terminase small subunit
MTTRGKSKPKSKPKAAKKPKAAATTTKTKPRTELSAIATFVHEYLIEPNASRAYRAAYPHVTERSAGTLGSRLLKKVEVQKLIAAGAKRTADKLELTRERIFQETARIAFFDPRKLFNADGSPKGITELDDDTAAALAGLDVYEEFADGRSDGQEPQGHGGSLSRRKRGELLGYVKKYKIADKNSALERGARLLALFKEDNAQRADPLRDLLQSMGRSTFPVAK